MFLCIYVYTYICTCMFLCTYVCIYACMHTQSFEVHMRAFPCPQILEIHMRKLRNNGRLDDQVWDAIPSFAGKQTEGYTGADLAGMYVCMCMCMYVADFWLLFP